MGAETRMRVVCGPPSEAEIRALVEHVEFAEDRQAVEEYIRAKALDLAQRILGTGGEAHVESAAREIGALALDAYMRRHLAVEIRKLSESSTECGKQEAELSG